MKAEKLSKLIDLADKHDYKPCDYHFDNLIAFVGDNASAISNLCKGYAELQPQLTAAMNSINNAQEALKSAGIEADTVQAGVMELVSRMNQLVAENAVLNKAIGAIADAYETGMADLLAKEIDTAVNIETPATDAYLNAVRAEGIDMWIASRNGAWNGTTKQAEQFASQLRAGNAGKDGV